MSSAMRHTRCLLLNFFTCPDNQVGGHICKHLHLCFLASKQIGHIVPSFEIASKSLRHEITRNETFEIKNAELGEVEITSTVSGQVNYVRLSSNICTCDVFSHHGTCVCIDIARSVCSQVAEMIILDEGEGEEVAMNSDNSDQMALTLFWTGSGHTLYWTGGQKSPPPG